MQPGGLLMSSNSTSTATRGESTKPLNYTAIILAGKRPGTDPVAAAFGEDYKALVPALGLPMITRVVTALCRASHIGRIVIATDDALGPLAQIPGLMEACANTEIVVIPTGKTICASVINAIEACPGAARFLVTTSDHPLLTGAMVDDFLTASSHELGLGVGMVEKREIETGYPGMRRTYLRFRGAQVSGANLFALNGREGMKAVRFWESIEANRKKPWKIFAAFGVINLLGVILKLFSIGQAFKRASEVVGCTARPILIKQAEAAIDVDKVQDLLTVDGILARRNLVEPQPAAQPSPILGSSSKPVIAI